MRSAEVWSSFHSDFVCLFEIVLRSAEVLFKTSFIFSLSRWDCLALSRDLVKFSFRFSLSL